MKLPTIIQRLEGAIIFLGAVYIYHLRSGNWLVFILVFLVIDASMVGYLMNNKIGAYIYNFGHTFVLPSLVYIVARVNDSSALTLLALIWFAHIALDRALGFGLKYEDGFKHTHLGNIGQK